MIRDLFWAFHPKRVMVPSLALRLALPLRCALGCPEMPNAAFASALARMFARIAASGMASISPAPNIGVGIRKMILGFPPWPLSGFPAGRKSGWEILHPGASVRPEMTKRLCTSPSLEPLGFRLKRASRMGPFGAMNQGTSFLAPLSVATAIKGLFAGLDPPGAGCEWQDRHWFELKRGPSPLLLPPATTSISANRVNPSWKNVVSSAVRSFKGPPAPGAPPRTPGSTGPFAGPPSTRTPGMIKIAATKATRIFTAVFRRVFMPLSSPYWKFMPWVYVEFGLDFVLWADYTLVSLIEFYIFVAAARVRYIYVLVILHSVRFYIRNLCLQPVRCRLAVGQKTMKIVKLDLLFSRVALSCSSASTVGALTGQPLGTIPSAPVGLFRRIRLTAQNVAGLKLLWKAQVKNDPRSLAALTAPVVADGSDDRNRHPQHGLRGGKLRQSQRPRRRNGQADLEPDL